MNGESAYKLIKNDMNGIRESSDVEIKREIYIDLKCLEVYPMNYENKVFWLMVERNWKKYYGSVYARHLYNNGMKKYQDSMD